MPAAHTEQGRTHEEHAARLLIHYFDAAGVVIDRDSRVEIAEIVSQVIKSALAEVALEVKRIKEGTP